MKPLTRREILTGAAATGAVALGVSAATAEPPSRKPGPQSNCGPAVSSKACAEDHGPRELFAVVNSRGVLQRGMHVASVNYLSLRLYEVIFRRDVRRGVYMATIGGHEQEGLPPVGYACVQGRSTNPRGVLVSTFNTQGESVDLGFHLLVVCPEGYA
jgi:hypothetical protein